MFRPPALALLLATLSSCRPAPDTPVATPATPPDQSPASQAFAFAFVDVDVFDGREVLRKHTVILDKQGQIAQIGPSANMPVPQQLPQLRRPGAMLLPGLIDAHTHVQIGQQLRQAAVFGVTTELDMFTQPSLLARLKRQQAKGKATDRADIFSAGILATAPGGHGTEYGFEIPTLTAADQAKEFVQARIFEGSDYIKIVFDDGSGYGMQRPTLDESTLRAVIEQAHQHQRLAVVHIGSQAQALVALANGADGLAHIFMDSPPTPQWSQALQGRNAFITDTLAVSVAMCDPQRHRDLAHDPTLGAYLTPVEQSGLSRGFPAATRPDCAYAFQAVQAAAEAGATILASTDAPNPGTLHGASMHAELEHLVHAGLTPAQALAAATSAPAQVFGLNDRGSIAVAKRGDLVLVEGDPTTDIRATRRIIGVWKQGREVDRKTYLERVTQAHQLVEKLAQRPPPPGSDNGHIADFEAGTIAANFGTGWQTSTDGQGSTAELKLVSRGAKRSKHALHISGEVSAKAGARAWAGATFLPSLTPMHPENLSGFRQLRFAIRSRQPRTVAVMLFDRKLGAMPATATVKADRAWKEVTLEVSEDFALDSMSGLQAVFFGISGLAGPFAFEIDNIRFE